MKKTPEQIEIENCTIRVNLAMRIVERTRQNLLAADTADEMSAASVIAEMALARAVEDVDGAMKDLKEKFPENVEYEPVAEQEG